MPGPQRTGCMQRARRRQVPPAGSLVADSSRRWLHAAAAAATAAVCPLPTPMGKMTGHYEFYAQCQETGQWRQSFLVKIGEFGLRAD